MTPFFKGRSPFQATDLKLFKGPIPHGNYCLVGWSPAKGFMQTVMEEFKSAENGAIGVYFYADNLFIFEKKNNDVSIISLDGEKMECSHDLADSRFY
jgi:hypothetical protein